MAIAFGALAGYYYLGYAGMQIPIGIMLDRFNFRIVAFISILVTSLGTLTFAASSNFNYLIIGRLMIGAGSAVGFLSVNKITRTYFPAKYHSLILGFSFTFGLVGAVFAIVNSGEFEARNDGATPISNRRATSDDVTNFS